jgi:hypothetical protein
MVNKSTHKQKQQEELKQANCKIRMTKYNFSQRFGEQLYAFSEEHHKDHFKVFNKALEEWSKDHEQEIADEINAIQRAGFTGTPEDIMDKIKISARFYYRKKSKREEKHPKKKEKQPYIGLSKQFIIQIDEYIKDVLISSKDAKRFNRKEAFDKFTSSHIENIKCELAELKSKYDEEEAEYNPKEIANKFKKAFENRYYTYFAAIKI